MADLTQLHDSFMKAHEERMNYLYEHTKAMQQKEEETKNTNINLKELEEM